MAEEQLKATALSRTVERAITDSGATSSYGKKAMSKCGTYALDTSALVATGLRSNKIFRFAKGNLGVADKVKHLPFDVRGAGKRNIHDSLTREPSDIYKHIFRGGLRPSI